MRTTTTTHPHSHDGDHQAQMPSDNIDLSTAALNGEGRTLSTQHTSSELNLREEVGTDVNSITTPFTTSQQSFNEDNAAHDSVNILPITPQESPEDTTESTVKSAKNLNLLSTNGKFINAPTYAPEQSS